MALLIRFHALDEQAEWLRRRIGDPAAISGIYLRGGSIFIVLAVVGSLFLTKAAASAPLAGAWDGVSDTVIEASRSLAKFLPGGANSRNLGNEFGDDTQIRGFWVADEQVYATIQLSPDEDDDFYWRAATFDTFNNNGWTASATSDVTKAADSPLLDGTLEDVADSVLTRPVTFTVTPVEYKGTYILSPQRPDSVSQTSNLRTIGPGGLFVALKRSSVFRAIHRHGDRADPRRGWSRVESADRGRDGLPRGDRGDLPSGPGWGDGPGQRGAAGRDGRRGAQRSRQLAVRIGQDHGDAVPSDHVQVRHERAGPAVRGAEPVDGRVLLDVQARVLPVLRHDDGHLPARARDPGPDRRGVPSGQPRRALGRGDPARPEPAPVGGGLLPELRLGPIRSDRWRGRSARTAADRGAAREWDAPAVVERRTGWVVSADRRPSR